MNILVTGVAGYIGSHTVVELMNADYHPIIVDDLSNARWDVRDRIGQITGRVPDFYEIDCADKMELQQVFKDYNGISVLELVNAFQKVNGIELPYVIGPRRDGDLPAFWADAEKAKKLLGWEATHTV